ncbi:MAG: hypothetical protein KatS3mg114_1224 [Planctomycetaceae bacterium]|nr:MAG: hypothetical protein KatS3mg114_1224 [Planctomycetaceae bacterium]
MNDEPPRDLPGQPTQETSLHGREDARADKAWRLAVFGRPQDPHVLATLLAQATGMLPLDALLHARRAPAVLAVELTAAQAQQLVQWLEGIGIQSAAVVVNDLPDFSQPHVLHHAHITPSGLEIYNLRGTVDECLPWSQLAVIAAGEVPGEETVRYPEPGSPTIVSAAPLPSTGVVEHQLHGQFELWLITHPPRVFCLEHRHFNYDGLGEEKTSSAQANFLHWLERLVSHAPQAWRTPATRALLAHDLHRKYEFESSSALQEQALLWYVMSRHLPHE